MSSNGVLGDMDGHVQFPEGPGPKQGRLEDNVATAENDFHANILMHDNLSACRTWKLSEATISANHPGNVAKYCVTFQWCRKQNF